MDIFLACELDVIMQVGDWDYTVLQIINGRIVYI